LLLSAVRAGDRYRSPAAGASTALSSECGQCHVDNGRGMRLNADLLAGLYCRERRVAWRGVCVCSRTQLPAWYDGFFCFANFSAFSNSSFNPLIYTGFNANFRRGSTQ